MIFECNGGHVFMRNTCINIDAKDGLFEVLIKDDNMKIEYKVLTPILINCGGLYAARIFNLFSGHEHHQRNRYIKGDYYSYTGR